MPDSWNDWELLFAKCATNEDFRNTLGQALRINDDSKVQELLEEIGVAGQNPAERSARIAALKQAFGPMVNVASVFGNMNVAGP